MYQIAVYGKGGIGKSTTVSNIAAVLSGRGLRVLQVGCDPKADSTSLLCGGQPAPAILDLLREGKKNLQPDQIIKTGFNGVLCAETGGPAPGRGCAGRGILTAFEVLKKSGAFDACRPDLVIYDVLGDVVCGGFTAPMRGGFARQVFIVTSGENMSIHAAANIGLAVQDFQKRGYASLGGLILNRRDVKNEDAKVQELADDLDTEIVGSLPRSSLVPEAEERRQTVVQAFAGSPMARQYEVLAQAVLEKTGL